jgi:hypothetical protein
VSEPNAYLAITGAGIEKVQIKKKALVYPFQKVTKFSITPFDFSMQLQAMTVEKLQVGTLHMQFVVKKLKQQSFLSQRFSP